MTKTYRQGAAGALLDIYEQAIDGLKHLIVEISDSELIEILDNKTRDSNCKSIQSILAHVVSAGYGYAADIRGLSGTAVHFPAKTNHPSVTEYIKDLENVLVFTIDTFQIIRDDQLEEFDNARKIKTSWGQVYDIEQMMEHAIVHILRHTRQIRKFMDMLQKQ